VISLAATIYFFYGVYQQFTEGVVLPSKNYNNARLYTFPDIYEETKTVLTRRLPFDVPSTGEIPVKEVLAGLSER
jgi:hypothetical protein